MMFETCKIQYQIWKGELLWKDIKSDSNQEQQAHSVVCTVASPVLKPHPSRTVPIVTAENWPQKLIMQLIPKSLVQQVGGTSSKYFQNARSVSFLFPHNFTTVSLTKLFNEGFAGCVHLNGDKDKVLILIFSPKDDEYLGYIPNEQSQFVECFRKVIQLQKV